MAISTNVPQPQFGPNGFIAPPESAVLTGVQQDWIAAFALVNKIPNFSTNTNSPTNATPQGQIAASEAAIIGDANAIFLWFCSQVDPAFSSGRMQDAIARIYFISRIPGAPTVQPCLCTGLVNTPIPVGALAQDQNGNLWVCQQAGTIPQSGNITLNFAFTQNGPNAGPVTLTIYQAIAGWDTIAPSGNAALGVNVETRSQFELRRSQSTAINSTGQLPSVLGAVLAVPNVLDAYVTENDNDTPQTVGGVSLNPHSLYVCVLGGTTLAVAQAIWSRKAPGCAYTGNTFITVTDPSPQYIPPVPSYLVSFELPTIVPFAVYVNLKNNSSIPSNALAQIQAAIISGFAGTDGGPRAKIGSTVFASRYYANVLNLGSWAEIIRIELGISGTAASIQGSINGTTLTVTSVSSGSLASGQLLQGSGLMSGSATVIASQLTGSVGGTGTYQISLSQTAVSQTLTATALGDSFTMNINQAPTVSANTIYLNLS